MLCIKIKAICWICFTANIDCKTNSSFISAVEAVRALPTLFCFVWADRVKLFYPHENKKSVFFFFKLGSKEFRHQYTLMRHLPTHTDERNFKCEACGKAFRQLSTLSQHKAIHSDARPYVCEFCKKTFNRLVHCSQLPLGVAFNSSNFRVSTLISHRKTHSELKPHKCHLCGKGFHQKGTFSWQLLLRYLYPHVKRTTLEMYV